MKRLDFEIKKVKSQGHSKTTNKHFGVLSYLFAECISIF